MVIQNCLQLLTELSEIEMKIEKIKKMKEMRGYQWSDEDDEKLLRTLIHQLNS